MTYPSKILLIGEHSILFDSQSLSVPFDRFSGEWKFVDENSESLLSISNKLDDSLINVSEFKKDCKNGLSFHSSIPQQFGLGSSGALTAAIYERYAHKIQTDILLLQSDLAKIESIFHGKSSGTDALVSFKKATIHSKNKQSIVLGNKPLQSLPFYVYLYNSSIKRSAKTYIDGFQELVKQSVFDIVDLCKTVDAVIDSILHGEDSILWDQLKSLSDFQYKNLPNFIPAIINPIWKNGLDNNSYVFKLCGAGGGGFFLVFSKDDILELFPDNLISLNKHQ